MGTEEDPKEVKIGALLHPNVKSMLIELLREYVDIFSWSYQDMPGLDTDIVEHHLPLKLECPPVKQKLRRTHPDMAVKNQRRSLKTDKHRFSCDISVSSMDNQQCACTKERWKSPHVRRLQRAK